MARRTMAVIYTKPISRNKSSRIKYIKRWDARAQKMESGDSRKNKGKWSKEKKGCLERERVKVVEPARENLSFKKRQKGKGRLGTRE